MIRGGTSSAGKCGNLRTEYTQQFIPCQLYLLEPEVISKLEISRRLTWSARIEIEDLSGNMVDITDASYFQVQKHLIGSIETASFTVEKADLWSIWGSGYTEVLRPSKRKIKIYTGLVGKEIQIYTGRITSVQETRGSGNLGAINVNCSDFRSLLRKEESTQAGELTSRYYEIYRLASQTFEQDAQQMLVINDADTWGLFLPSGNSETAVNETISGQPAWSLGAGTVVVFGNRQRIVFGDVLHITDKHISWATRTFADSSVYNSAFARGLSGDEILEQEVTIDADIVKRGKVSYPQTIGTDNDQLSDMIVFAQEVIERSQSGTLNISIDYNPYLLPGQIVRFSSSRFNIPETTTKLQAVRHQYRHGSCTTFIDAIELIPEVNP